MKLKDLREQMKASYADARASLAYTGSDTHNMRQFWKKTCHVIEMNKDLPGDGLIHHHLIKFHRAGLIYYYAKEHGVQAAMLYKLNMQ